MEGIKLQSRLSQIFDRVISGLIVMAIYTLIQHVIK